LFLGYRRIQLLRRTHSFNGSIAPTHAWGKEVQAHIPHNSSTGGSGTGVQGVRGVVRKEVEERILFLMNKGITGFQTCCNKQRNSSVIAYRCILAANTLCHTNVTATLLF
jgi:hypothetical protein